MSAVSLCLLTEGIEILQPLILCQLSTKELGIVWTVFLTLTMFDVRQRVPSGNRPKVHHLIHTNLLLLDRERLSEKNISFDVGRDNRCN